MFIRVRYTQEFDSAGCSGIAPKIDSVEPFEESRALPTLQFHVMSQDALPYAVQVEFKLGLETQCFWYKAFLKSN